MDTVQLSVHNIAFASRLERELRQVGGCQMISVKTPDLHGKGLVVLDEETLDTLPSPLDEPERFLLVTRNESPKLKRAWEQGIVSVVFEHDSPHTICLAVQSALLRIQSPHRNTIRCAISPRANVSDPKVGRTAAQNTMPVTAALKNQHSGLG